MLPSSAVTGVVLAFHAISFLTVEAAETGRYAVFRSQDRGQTWSRSDSGLPPHARINAFGVVRRSVFAGTDQGIYVSRNQGSNWTVVSGTAGVGRILNFATVGMSIYAGTDRNGVLVSRDEGVTWAVNAGIPFRKVRALLAHSGALYAGTDDRGVFVSRDDGRSWLSISDGLPGRSQVFSLAASKGKIFAGLYSKGLYVRANETSWRRIDSISPLVLAATGDTLLAGHNPGGILRSDDLGATWTPGEIVFSSDLGKAPVWEMGAGPDVAMAGVSLGIYRSEDRGRTWERARTGLPKRSSGISFLLRSGWVLAAVSLRTSE